MSIGSNRIGLSAGISLMPFVFVCLSLLASRGQRRISFLFIFHIRRLRSRSFNLQRSSEYSQVVHATDYATGGRWTLDGLGSLPKLSIVVASRGLSPLVRWQMKYDPFAVNAKS